MSEREIIIVAGSSVAHEEEYPWIDDRRVPFMIVRGDVHLHGVEEEPD